jgi:dTDP-4-amino-4,6-dideoxygalactose transaminase
MLLMGWKYNMDNIHAALLLPQMDRLESNWRLRQELALAYEEHLANIPGVEWPATVARSQHARHLFPVWVNPDQRDAVIDGLQAAGIGVVVNYRAIHLLTYFRQMFGFEPGTFPNAENIGDRTLSLPFYPRMPLESVERVSAVLADVLARESATKPPVTAPIP